MNRVRVLIVVILMLGTAWAGTQYEVRCSNKGCGFTTSIGIGGGFKFEEASGYCRKCEKVVSVTWKRDSNQKPAHRAFWDALTGEVRELFSCPECKGPFVAIQSVEEFKHCPKCGKPTLKPKRGILYD
jgi:hypothetical protein